MDTLSVSGMIVAVVAGLLACGCDADRDPAPAAHDPTGRTGRPATALEPPSAAWPDASPGASPGTAGS